MYGFLTLLYVEASLVDANYTARSASGISKRTTTRGVTSVWVL